MWPYPYAATYNHCVRLYRAEDSLLDCMSCLGLIRCFFKKLVPKNTRYPESKCIH